MLPEASTKTGRPAPRASGAPARDGLRRLVVDQDAVCARRECLREVILRLDLDLDRGAGRRESLRRGDGALDSSRQPTVVVLDEDHLGQIVPVIPAAAVPDGLAVEGTKTRSGLARVEDLAGRSRDGLHETPRRRRDPAHALEKIQGHALGRQDRPGAPGEPRERSTGREPRLRRPPLRSRRAPGPGARRPGGRPAVPKRRTRTWPRARRASRVPAGTVASVVTSRPPTSSERNRRRQSSSASADRGSMAAEDIGVGVAGVHGAAGAKAQAVATVRTARACGAEAFSAAFRRSSGRTISGRSSRRHR